MVITRRLAILFASAFIFSVSAFGDESADSAAALRVDRILLKGEIIDDDNIAFKLSFKAKAENGGAIQLVSGSVCEKNSLVRFSSGFSLLWGGGDNFSIRSDKGSYSLKAEKAGECDVEFDFASKVLKKGVWRESSFALLPAISRDIEIFCGRKDVELEISGALQVVKKDAPDGKGVIFTAALPPEGDFKIKWRSHIERLDAKLIVSVEPAIISTVFPGTVRNFSVFDYKVIQGKLNELTLNVSPDLNVLKVSGEAIRDWRLEKDGDARRLKVSLSREFDKDYKLTVVSEKVLSKIPCAFVLPRISPENVLRIDGRLAFGTSKAIKLVVTKTAGLNQIDDSVFPLRRVSSPLPAKSLYAYSFSSGKYSLEATAENISPSFSVEMSQVVDFRDEELLLRAALSLDVKDAPLKELLVAFPAELAVNRVKGSRVRADEYELVSSGETSKKTKLLRVPLLPDTMGKVDIELFFERNIRGAVSTDIPVVRVEKAKSARGYLLLAASRGLSLTASDTAGLKKVHPGSIPFKIPGLLLSYKFKGWNWSGKVEITHEKTSLVSDTFHLATVGEGAVYGLSFFNYRISGAPTDKLMIVLRKGMNNPEFTGADIVDWRKIKEDDDRQYWQVNFKEKLFGDYKLLATYESPLPSGKKSVSMRFGDVFTENAAAASGFIVIASKENLKVVEKGRASASVMELEASELPRDYAALVHNPVIKAYKFYKSPHWVDAELAKFQRVKLVGTLVDYARLNTRVALNGELVTKVECRLKNASRQFLKMKLPEGSELWNVSVDGARKRVSESSGAKGVYLVPIPRKKDTDEPVALSISYARKLSAELGSGTSFHLVAPEFDIDSLSLRWKITVPDNYDFTSIESNMMTRGKPRLSGFSGMYSNMLAWWQNWTRSASLVGFFIMFCGGSLLAYAWGRGKLRILLSVVSCVAMLFGCVMIAGSLFRGGIHAPADAAVNSVVFTKLFATTANAPEMRVAIEDMEASSFMKFFWFFVLIVPALWLLRSGLKRKSPFFFALSVVLASAALSRWLPASHLLGLSFAIFIPAGLFTALITGVFKKSKAARIAATMALALSFPLFFASANAAEPAEAAVVVDSVDYEITATASEVRAVASFAVTAESPGDALIVPAPVGITGDLPDDDDIRIERKGGDYYVKMLSTGKTEFKLTLLLPLKKEMDGVYTFPLPLPNSRRNSARVAVGLDNSDISTSDAVSFKTTLENGKITATATFVPGTKPLFRLFPLKRKVRNENTRFFVNTTSVANFAGGVVDIKHVLDFNIAQGELARIAVKVPRSMGVSAVSVPDLGAWRYSPKNNTLEVFLTRPRHDKLKMLVTTQMTDCVLPYERKLEVLEIEDAGKQHGTFSVGVSRGVRIEVEATKGMSPINIDDFTRHTRRGALKMRKAFRYFTSEAFLKVKAFAVLPELRVMEKCSVGFEEERTTLVSDLAVEVSKAGVFDVTIGIPKGFDIDKLTGDSVKNWDELTRDGKNIVVAHFSKRVLGATLLHLELMSEKPRPKVLVVPRLEVFDARKLKGTLSINLERGTRMDIREKRGLESAAAALSAGKSSKRFSIVRPDWFLKVAFEIATPWIQLDNLQICSVSDGALEYDCVFRYKIENAGIKRFKLRLPVGAEVPEFLGRGILSYGKLDSNLWEIHLKRKVLGSYRLNVKFRVPLGKMGEVVIKPVKTLNLNLRKGYFTVAAEDSLQIKQLAAKGDISEFDARKIPAAFNSKYLADAVLCYRTVGDDFSIKLSVGRNKAVKLLRAEIKKLTLASLVSEEGEIITDMRVDLLNVGSEHFLALKLPPNSQVWSVFIDRTDSLSNPGQPVEAAEENGRLLIPLKQNPTKPQKIELVYSTKPQKDWRNSRQFYVGPRFELPLNDISWNLHLPEKMEYDDFSGTLKYKERRWIPTPEMNLSEYDRVNSEKKWRKRKMVRKWLSKATTNAKRGDIQAANTAFQNAADFALDDNELREDVRGEWQEAQSMNVLNLFRKRSPRRSGSGGVSNRRGQNGGQYELSQVSGKEMRAVKSISNKMFKQQLAAGSPARPLVFSLPSNGRVVEFERPLQVRTDTPMRVEFSAEPAENGESVPGPISAFLVLVALLYALLKSAAILAKRPASKPS